MSCLKKSPDNIVSVKPLRNCLGPILAAGILLTGCAAEQEVELGTIGFISGFFGGVAADEPNAVLHGRDVLTAGGTAVDAAVAMAFTLSVTSPSNVSLGGGGVCMVHDSVAGINEVLDFTVPAAKGQAGRGKVGIPTFARGLVALHSRYGNLDWRGLLAKPEQMARLGHRLSRASALELNRAYSALARDPEIKAVYSTPNGQQLQEGDTVQQINLGTMIGRIRGQGAGVMYSGQTAKQYVTAVQSIGGKLTMEDLRDYRPVWHNTLDVPFDDSIAHFTVPGVGSGELLAVAFAQLIEDERYEDADSSERPHMVLEALRRAYIRRGQTDGKSWQDERQAYQAVLSEDLISGLVESYKANQTTPIGQIGPLPRRGASPAGAGLLVVDPAGMAVACEFGMNNLYGIGRMAPGTGVLIAAAPSDNRNSLNLGPIMVSNRHTFSFQMALAGGGGIAKDAAALTTLAEIMLAGKDLKATINAPRYTLGPTLQKSYVEKTGGAEVQSSLAARGHQVEPAGSLGRINAMYCPSGLPMSDPTKIVCGIERENRWHGLSILAQ